AVHNETKGRETSLISKLWAPVVAAPLSQERQTIATWGRQTVKSRSYSFGRFAAYVVERLRSGAGRRRALMHPGSRPAPRQRDFWYPLVGQAIRRRTPLLDVIAPRMSRHCDSPH